VDKPQGGLDVDTEVDIEEPKDDKPFDDEPFDAGVEASEEEEPEKYIQQLSGKLGQSLRKYTEEQGQPNLELEKFAINSVISATNTADMNQEDKKDIIDKIESSGANDDMEPSDDIEMGDEQPDEEFGGEEENFEETLKLTENSCNFVENSKEMIKTTLKENFDCGCDQTIDEIIDEIVEDGTEVKPIVKPDVKPETKPSRRSKPYRVPIIRPEESPRPKAMNENKIEIKPQNIWWENDPEQLLRVVYWSNNQVPPVEPEARKEAFIKIANQLDAKFPAPEGRKEEMLSML
jgi:hypothetical protein